MEKEIEGEREPLSLVDFSTRWLNVAHHVRGDHLEWHLQVN